MAAATIALLSLLSLALPAAAAPPDSGFVLRAVRAARAPLIDGEVAEAEWAGAAVAGRFIQYEPLRGSPSEFSTQALVLYDSAHLYVAFRIWDPEEPTAQLTRRDAELENDDAVVVVLDSHNDHRSAYYFMTNALGTQADGRVANDGRTVDATWDAPWRSAAARAEYGWTVEIAIPLTSIKYAAGRDVTWGINFGRSRRRTLEVSFWAGPLEQQFRVSQGGSLVGLDIAPPARRHQLIAYGLSRLQEDARGEWQAGGDLRYALTPELSAYLTANPDFATIEADQEQVNLTRFELQLPEKRPFFLEGAELFQQRIRTFYSRRIGGVDGGGQALGKAGPWTLATLVAHGEAVGDTASGTYAVGRFQRDVFGSSNVALTVANRTLDGENRGSAGLDATLFFTKTLGMTAQLIESWGPYGRGTWAYFIRPAYDSPTGHFHVRYTHLGDRFKDHVNAVGFIRDDDRRELDSALRRTFWIQRGTFERLEYGSNYNIYWSQRGSLRSWQIDQSVEVEFRNRLSMEAAYREEFKAEDGKLFQKDFRNREFALEVGYNTREYQSVQVGYRFGRNFDSDFSLWTAAAAYKLTPQLSLEYELERLTLDPDPEDKSTWIHVVRANQFFTRDLYLRLFFQANTRIRREDVQAVFVYRYRPPFGTFQLAYQHGTAELGQPSEQGDALFLKLTVVL
jgi:LmbE family N-acetylglucosaminyl deacetylase